MAMDSINGGGVVLPLEFLIADIVLAAAGVVLLVRGALEVRRTGSAAWLAGGCRPNRLAPEMVAVPMAAFLLLQFAVGLPIQAASWGGAPPAAMALLAGAVVKAGAGAVCLGLAQATFVGGAAGFLAGQRRWPEDLRRGLLGFVAAYPLCWALSLLSEWVIRRWNHGWVPPEHELLRLLEQPGLPGWVPAMLWISAVIVAPLAEEAFFRGICQTALNQAFNRPLWSVVLVSCAFGAAHASQPQVVLPLIVLGVAMGITYERGGSLIAPITLHLVFNLKTMLFFTASKPG